MHLGDGLFLYYYHHDIDHTVIDRRDYEPFIAIAGARQELGARAAIAPLMLVERLRYRQERAANDPR